MRLLAALLTIGLLFACGSKPGGTAPPPPAAGDLVAWREAGSLDAGLLTLAVIELGLTGVTVSGGATCYKLTYRTPNVSGNLINASGLVCLPAGRSGGRPVISYQHGTIFRDGEAPSSGFSTSGEGLIGAILAGVGYVAVLPDYIGYGDSTDELHPYVHAATLASSTIDMNRAARRFLDAPGINVAANGRFFLTGYSEGGYATLAAQRLMEQSLAAEFPITASEPGAGPYDLTGTTRILMGQPTLPQPAFTGFFLKSYDSIYSPSSLLSSMVSATYADAVNTRYDGNYSRDEINLALGGRNVATSELFNPAFLASYLDSGFPEFKARIAENDIYDWAPTVPTRLFHGVSDEVVPYDNAVTAKAAMEANGTTAVTLVDCDAGALPTTHSNCARPFARDMIVYFNALAGGP